MLQFSIGIPYGSHGLLTRLGQFHAALLSERSPCFGGVVTVFWQRGWSCGGEMPPSATYLCGSEEPLAKLGCVLWYVLPSAARAAGAPAPTVWEIDSSRQGGAEGYEVIAPDLDPRRDYQSIYDASGNGSLLNELISRIAKGGEIVLAGFYTQPLNFAFPPAFMKEARIRIAAEWQKEDMIATRALIENGALSLAGLITHHMAAEEAHKAYPVAFDDPACLKMMLNWKDVA